MKRVIAYALCAVSALAGLILLQVGLTSSQAAEAPRAVPKQQVVVQVVQEFPRMYQKQAEQAVFSVHPYGERFNEISNGGGTGFFIETVSGAKYILTNRHVCQITASEYYLLKQGEAKFVAKRIAMSSLADLCILVPPKELVLTRKPYQLSMKRLLPGDLIAAYGHPFLRPLTSAVGVYINETREPINMVIPGFAPSDLITIGRSDMLIFPGNSGSPVIDVTGAVVGIVFAYEGPGKAGLFVPMSEIKDFLETHE